MEGLTEEERTALRGSKFAPLPSLSAPTRNSFQPRQAHPGGPLKTNKAAALAKFLERKLQEPDGLSSINPQLLDLAVRNAKQTVLRSGGSSSGRIVQHVDSFGDSEDPCEEDREIVTKSKKLNKKKKKKTKKDKKKKKKQKVL